MARKHTLLLCIGFGCESMDFKFRKKPKLDIPVGKHVNQRIQHKKIYQEQLDRLDQQLQHENIDQLERERLRTILEKKCNEQQQDW